MSNRQGYSKRIRGIHEGQNGEGHAQNICLVPEVFLAIAGYLDLPDYLAGRIEPMEG